MNDEISAQMAAAVETPVEGTLQDGVTKVDGTFTFSQPKEVVGEDQPA